MKRMSLFIAIVAACMTGVPADSSAALVLYATGTLDKDTDTAKTDNSRTTTESRAYELEIKVTNFSDADEECEIAWYYIERALDEEGDKLPPTLSKGGQKTVRIPAGQSIREHIVSHVLTVKTAKVTTTKKDGKKKRTTTETTISGSEFEDYIVVVRQDGRIVKSASGNRKFLKEEWLGQLDAAQTVNAR